MRYAVKTSFSKDQIEQDLLLHDDLNKTVKKISTEVMNLRDSGVREALIKLGWTPPEADNPK